MVTAYDETDDDLVKTQARVHATGEQTHVALLSCGDSAYVAVAYDVFPGEYEPIAADCIAYDPTLEGAHKKAERWMENNPKGVAPGDDGGSGMGRKIMGGLKRLNEYGNELTEKQQQQQQHGGPKQ